MLEAMRSIKDSFSRSIFYWLTFVLTSMFMFVFFNLSYNDAVGVSFINAKNNASLLITVLVIAVCMIIIFFANDFYVRKKSKEIAVRLVCGATFLHIAFYTLFQTFILFMLAIPVGILIGYMMLPMLESLVIIITSQSVHLVVKSDAITSTALIIAVEIIFCTILNVGYVYRSSIQALINEKSIEKVKFKFPIQILSHRTKQIMNVICFVIPIPIMYMNYKNQEGILIMSVIGMIGLYGCMSEVLIPVINRYIKKHIHSRMKVSVLGLVRDNIKILRNNIILLIVSDVLSISIMTSSETAMEMIICIVSFVVINILLTLSIMFKFSSEVVGRKKSYAILEHIGYTTKQTHHIMILEVIIFYALVWLLSMMYLLNILIILSIHHILTIIVVICLLGCFITPLLLSAIGTYIYYRKEVWG